MRLRNLIYSFALLLLTVSVAAAEGDVLTLEKAIQSAGQKDPLLMKVISQKNALEEKAVSESQLPDPKVSLAVKSLPVDGGSYTREGMTQLVIGAQQSFPRGKTLSYKGKKIQALAAVEKARYEDQWRQIVLNVRKSWLDLYYWHQAAKTIEEDKKSLGKVIQSTEALYSTGRQNSQDIIRAELELNFLEDREVDVQRQIEMAQAELSKWIGIENAKQSIDNNFPSLPDIGSLLVIREGLSQHPKTLSMDAAVIAGQHGVHIAEQQYKPGFSVGMNYGIRNGELANGDDRPDFASAIVTLDVPLFTKKRQDKKLSASKYSLRAKENMRDDVLRNLDTMLDKSYASWMRFEERIKHYENTVLDRAEENFEAALQAYNSDLTDFSSLMRAQVMELDARLKWLKLRIDKAKAQSDLLYLMGENS